MGVAWDIVCTGIRQTSPNSHSFWGGAPATAAMLRWRITVYKSFDEIHSRYFRLFFSEWVRGEQGGMMTCDGAVSSWHWGATANSLSAGPDQFGVLGKILAFFFFFFYPEKRPLHYRLCYEVMLLWIYIIFRNNSRISTGKKFFYVFLLFFWDE